MFVTRSHRTGVRERSYKPDGSDGLRVTGLHATHSSPSDRKRRRPKVDLTRLDGLLRLDVRYVNSREFEDEGFRQSMEQKLAGHDWTSQTDQAATDATGCESSWLDQLWSNSLLEVEEEKALFLTFNYLKYRAVRMLDSVDHTDPQEHILSQIEASLGRANQIRDRLIRANLHLVHSIVKRYADWAVDFNDALSQGYLALMRTVEQFDVGRGNRFSTYATWAVRYTLNRFIPKERQHQLRFRTGSPSSRDIVANAHEEFTVGDVGGTELRSIVVELLARLECRERRVLVERFGLSDGRPRTLAAIGNRLGISKERVRQIESRALGTLRTLIEKCEGRTD